MNRRILSLVVAIVLAGGVCIGVYFGQRSPTPSGPTNTTFVIEGVEFNGKPGKTVPFDHRGLIGFRAADVKASFTIHGSFSPKEAAIDGELVVKAVVIKDKDQAMEKRYAIKVDPKKPGTWSVTVSPEDPWPLPLNRNCTVTTLRGKELGTIRVGDVPTIVVEKTIVVAQN